ncbi:hypothetical protein ABZW18_15520 [Streptomyces sp. NPDC004647]|uniref:hypothetical protein n=1 Tax=Streptomyces sp. NPDC004647 TaxID=3154671 RepID=UPI0033A0C956
MRTASFTPAHRSPLRGSTALSNGFDHHRHVLGNALRAIRVYAGAAFSVVVLGEFAEPEPVIRR